MLVVANRLPVAEGHEEEFVEQFEEQLQQVRHQDGLARVELLAPADGGDHHVIKAYWESREAFEQWQDSEAFREAHADIPAEMFTDTNQLDVYERTLAVGPEK